MSKIKQLKQEIEEHINLGEKLYYRMLLDCNAGDESLIKEMKKLKLPYFEGEYEQWYTKSIYILKQTLQERLEDFKLSYKSEHRKEIDFQSYSIYDYLLGIVMKRGEEIIIDRDTAIPKMRNQISIMKSCSDRFDSILYDIKDIVQADLFDDELEAAREINKKGFVRGAGAIAGVVLESHLSTVCEKHSLKIKKTNPSINDYNQLLKDNDIIDTPTWRFVQHLADVRNTCDHKKTIDPKQEAVDELIDGVSRITKTVF